MSKILENKQLIHVVSEVLILGGLILHFKKKNTELVSYIEKIEDRLENQDRILLNHENMIQRLMNTSRVTIPHQSVPKRVNTVMYSKPKIETLSVTSFSSSSSEADSTESYMDAELEDELRELAEAEAEIDLKREK